MPTSKEIAKHLLFFIITLITTTLAGAEWITGKTLMPYLSDTPLSFADVYIGLEFSIPFLFVLTVHEFGHYITARIYKLAVSLPLYLPLWLGFLGMPSIGTAGAFIKLKDTPRSSNQYFDVGIAGPIAGFIAALIILWYGFYHLPPIEYIFNIHPEYKKYGADFISKAYTKDGTNISLGSNLLMDFFKSICPTPDRIPPAQEMMHYPYLLAGFLSLIFTSINLLPIGQLDGGHVLYGVFGTKIHSRVSPIIYLVFLTYAGLGLPDILVLNTDTSLYGPLLWNIIYLAILYFICKKCVKDRNAKTGLMLATIIFGLQYAAKIIFPGTLDGGGWIVFALVVGQFLGVYHPPAMVPSKLGTPRLLLAIFALFILIVCFSYSPITSF